MTLFGLRVGKERCLLIHDVLTDLIGEVVFELAFRYQKRFWGNPWTNSNDYNLSVRASYYSYLLAKGSITVHGWSRFKIWNTFLLCISSCCGDVCFSEYKVHSHNRNGLCAVAFMDDHKYSLPVKKLLVRNIVKLDESESHYKYAVRSTFDNCSHTQHCCNVSVHYWTCLIGNVKT